HRQVRRLRSLERLLEGWIGAQLKRTLLQNEIRSHAAVRKIPHAVAVLGAIRTRIEMPRPIVARPFEKIYQQQRALLILTTEAKVLVETRDSLGVQIDVKELPVPQRLRDSMVEIEPDHRLVRDFGIQS